MSSSESPTIRFLWVPDPAAAQIPLGERVADRYEVVAPQIWCDRAPHLSPDVPEELPERVTPYLRLFPHRLHLPEVYGVVRQDSLGETQEFLLLENGPLTASGELYPALEEAWTTASPVRQVYWLWQILELWTPFLDQKVGSSLLSGSRIRVQGWRVWLRELESDRSEVHLRDLAACWQGWLALATPHLQERLEPTLKAMQEESAELLEVAPLLNQVLLELAAEQPLSVQVAGGSDTGPKRSHNEDTCYPMTVFPPDMTVPDDEAIPELAIVCDGIGGHEGGEVASQLAVRSLKLLIQGLLVELDQQTELVMPQVWQDHLESAVRVVNNQIAAQNDTQGRELRQRMGTTLVMALQLPQRVGLQAGRVGNSHELYIAHVGDSRAYWMTPNYCQLLTVDDDVSVREVRMGRSLYREALRRPDAGALTQALGTRDAEFVRPTVRRFILEEDGILLLCSDGLSDRDRIESAWADYTPLVCNGAMSLDRAVQAWIDLANEKNGHDNTSVVLFQCRIANEFGSEKSDLTILQTSDLLAATSRPGPINGELASQPQEVFLQQATPSPDLVDENIVPPEVEEIEGRSPQSPWKNAIALLGLLLVLLIGGAVGLVTWWRFDPDGVLQLQQRLMETLGIRNSQESNRKFSELNRYEFNDN
ncbi:protein phosphatase 2C domain-containing protein [Desertifilum sp. FACHB-1129]|uniref:PPM-type phosphatase domain-containing protein n=1 Tax=Desertifilum tharense IPPAS B-1220 TaxID=1781255 RepID=A0A1E5QG53_9CYAN|nr:MULTISPECIES: protein phosphatase 2C domain-containing protein [Desertifilum]MDA0209303.1 protein phosphatase 2C domain-containing protein [Cyanobacteria bacterium FC1]MBD2314930.1 protein phosphatase 2C domain-containing protein [Desertifilum sp. FACHB-1129]MBD2325151.1 protein phosphatase 2C domain-containing protein [Desertifilum sp. FACHB-866]MBD2332707.1 protein phosphatase 2C domain-containing protein [Desertifilum sp. FACHB-868]OEJ73680.1 hypothetical protein BH720_18385 [Desertifilu